MAILTTSGRTAIALAVAAQPLHLAWGTGDPAWDAVPVPEPTDASALVAELGRHAVDVQTYCTPDPAGGISVPEGRYKTSSTPTNYLYVQFNFDYADEPTAVIREVGVFLGTAPKATVPPGKGYLLPADLESPGVLLALQRVPAIPRSSATRQSFEFVLEL